MTRIKESYRRADQEGQTPSEGGVNEFGVEQHNRTACAHCRSDPEASVDEKVGPAAQPGEDKLLYCRIDGSVFAADSSAGDEAEHDEAPGVPRQARGRGGNKINRERDREELLASPTVGQPAEQNGAEHSAGEISAAGEADL
jgi:hypothetical protein